MFLIYYYIHILIYNIVVFYQTFDHSSYLKNLCNYHLFYRDLIHHQIFFVHDINIFIFTQKFWIKRIVKYWLKSQRRHTLKYTEGVSNKKIHGRWKLKFHKLDLAPAWHLLFIYIEVCGDWKDEEEIIVDWNEEKGIFRSFHVHVLVCNERLKVDGSAKFRKYHSAAAAMLVNYSRNAIIVIRRRPQNTQEIAIMSERDMPPLL